MSVNKADISHARELNLLINSAYRGPESKKGWTTEESILGGIRINEETLQGYFLEDKITILKYTNDEDVILGSVYLEVKKPQLYLGLFAVSPTAQNQGIGKILLAEAEQFALANNCNCIAITVISSRTELIAWYERNGYRATGESIAFDEIEGRFGDPKTDGIRLISMEKPLVV